MRLFSLIISVILVSLNAAAQDYNNWLEVAFLDTLEYGNSETRMVLSVGTIADRQDVVNFAVSCEPSGRALYFADRGQPVGGAALVSFVDGDVQRIALTPARNGIGGTSEDQDAIDFVLAGMATQSEMRVTYEDSGYTHRAPLSNGAEETGHFISSCAAMMDGTYDLATSLGNRAGRAAPYGQWLPAEFSMQGTGPTRNALLSMRTDGSTRSNAAITARCHMDGTAVVFLDTVVPFLEENSVAIGVDESSVLIGLRRLGIDPPGYAGWSNEPVVLDIVAEAMTDPGVFHIHYIDSNHGHVIQNQDGSSVLQQFREACAELRGGGVASADPAGSEWQPVHTVDTNEGAYGRRLTLFVSQASRSVPVFAALGCGPGFMRISVMDQRRPPRTATSTLTFRFDDGPERYTELEWQRGNIGTSYDERAVQSFLEGIGQASRIRFQIGEDGIENDVPLFDGASAAAEFAQGCRDG